MEVKPEEVQKSIMEVMKLAHRLSKPMRIWQPD